MANPDSISTVIYTTKFKLDMKIPQWQKLMGFYKACSERSARPQAHPGRSTGARGATQEKTRRPKMRLKRSTAGARAWQRQRGNNQKNETAKDARRVFHSGRTGFPRARGQHDKTRDGQRRTLPMAPRVPPPPAAMARDCKHCQVFIPLMVSTT